MCWRASPALPRPVPHEKRRALGPAQWRTVRGQGITKDDHKGDLIIEVQVSVPEKLTEEQEKAMRDFADAGGLKY